MCQSLNFAIYINIKVSQALGSIKTSTFDTMQVLSYVQPWAEFPSWTFTCILVCISCIILRVIRKTQWTRLDWKFQAFASSNECALPPSVQGSFLSGVRHKWKRLHQRGDMFNDYMNSVFRENGPTHAIVEPYSGETKTIYTIEPDNIKTMLHTKFSDYHRSRNMPNALDPVMGQGVFTSNGKAWAHSRSLVRAQFSTQRVRNVAKLEPYMQNAFEEIGKIGEDGWTEPLEILLTFNRFTMDSATEFMFGTSADSHRVAMREKELFAAGKEEKGMMAKFKLIMTDFGTAFDIALDYVALRLKLGRLWFLADGFWFRLACYKVQSYVDNYIREATAHAEEAAKGSHNGEKGAAARVVDLEAVDSDDRRYGLISELVGSYPDKVALRNQVMQLLVAGRDTTAATLTWAFILLEAHPTKFDRLQSEIIEHFGTESNPRRPVTFDNLKSCAYLQWVVSEVIRLYPTGPLNARKASVNTVLPTGGGIDGKSPVAVKAGSTVAYNTYLLHRREELWGEDSWEFEPKRWEEKKAGWEYIPFHGGPQTCLGRKSQLFSNLHEVAVGGLDATSRC